MKLTVAFPFAVPARTLAVLVLGASLGGFVGVAHSQTTPPNDPPPAVPDTVATADTNTDIDAAPNAPQTPTNHGAYAQANNATEGTARAQTRQLALERRMRDMMTRNGITTTTTQDAILAFMRDDEDGKRAVRDAGRRLWNGIRRDAPAERLRALLSDYQKALDTAHDNREHAQTALDARVGYSLDPRLESMLWLLGVLGEGQTVFTLPQPAPNPRGPRMMGGNGAPPVSMFVVPNGAMQIDGFVNAKNSPQEMMVWLEIRDANGRLWRMVPSNNPDAQPILMRQINGLALGAHVLVRLVAPPIITPNTPYSLVALANAPDVNATDTEQDNGDGGDGGNDAAPPTDGQYK